MESITLTQTVDAPPDAVREAIQDVEPFMRAAGFDEVSVEGDRMHIANGFALAQISLELDLVEDPDAVLAYEQREGIFESMWTEYALEETDEGTAVTVTTDFELDIAGVGAILDGTVIKRQRKRELTAQFDYLDAEVGT